MTNTSSRHRSGPRGVANESSGVRGTGGRSISRGTTTGSGQRGGDAAGTSSDGLTNARTRLVGSRTGLGADSIVFAVRVFLAIRDSALRAARAVGAVVTPFGWAMILIVISSFLIGYLAGWVELAGVAWAGLVLLAIASLFLIGRTAHKIELSMPHNRVVVGEKAVGQILVANETHRRLLGGQIEVPVGAGLAEFPLPSLGAGAVYDDVFVVPTSHRGVIQLGPVRTVRGDPTGLFRREREWAARVELFVHPRTISIPSTSTGFVRDLEGNSTRDITSSDVSFHALREYLPGDERRYIHWKSTAKTGTYMVRQFEETRRSHLIVAQTLATADYATPEEFELAVSATGSLGVRAIRDGRTVSVVVSAKTPEFAKRKVFAVRALSTLGRSRLLDDLATLEPAETALGIIDLARVAAEQVAGVSVAFLVAGSNVTANALRAASVGFPDGVEVVAVVCDPGIAPTLRRVSDLSVLTIGYLEDLQKFLARSKAA